jgi:DNA-binding CsgD family transcriptional regulator
LRFSVAHLDWLADEADNIRAALRWTIDHGELEAGLRLANAACALWYVRGHCSEGRAWFGELLARAGPAADTTVGAKSLGYAARLAYIQGDFGAAEELTARSLRLSEQLDHPQGVALAGLRAASIARGRGQLARARALSAEALARSRALADADLEVFNLYGLSTTTFELGLVDEAEELARQCLTASMAVGQAWGLASGHRVLARVAARRGASRTARSHLDQSLAHSRRLGDAPGTVYALIALGHAARLEAEPATAGALFRQALDLAHRLGDRLELLHGLEGLGRLDAGARPERAVQLAAAAAALRETLGAPPYPREREDLAGWLARTRRALGESASARHWRVGATLALDALVAGLVLEPAAPVPATAPGGAGGAQRLTGREREVARLVASGRSTRAIAGRLRISEGTVKVHVARILNKLGLHSRVQLAAWVAGRDLAPPASQGARGSIYTSGDRPVGSPPPEMVTPTPHVRQARAQGGRQAGADPAQPGPRQRPHHGALPRRRAGPDRRAVRSPRTTPARGLGGRPGAPARRSRLRLPDLPLHVAPLPVVIRRRAREFGRPPVRPVQGVHATHRRVRRRGPIGEIEVHEVGDVAPRIVRVRTLEFVLGVVAHEGELFRMPPVDLAGLDLLGRCRAPLNDAGIPLAAGQRPTGQVDGGPARHLQGGLAGAGVAGDHRGGRGHRRRRLLPSRRRAAGRRRLRGGAGEGAGRGGQQPAGHDDRQEPGARPAGQAPRRWVLDGSESHG